MPTQTIYTQPIDTPIGPLLAGATAQALLFLGFSDRERAEAQFERICHRLDLQVEAGPSAILDTLADEIDRYFRGLLHNFSVPLAPPGTSFQQRAWQALIAIPYGGVLTYAQIAQQIGAPNANRAVGAANGQNPISILIPCHRLISTAGKLTGYGGGLWRKQFLLDLEARGIASGSA